jgi:subtilase family serine protease
MTRRIVVILCSLCLVAIPFVTSSQWRAASAAAAPGSAPFARVCGVPAHVFARCNADVIANASGVPLASATPPATSYGPVQFHTAYNLPCTPGGAVSAACSQPSSFGGQTIAIVDAFDDPTAESDLATYDTQFGLPACTTANGCFRKVNQTGGTTYPGESDGWAFEISLDVQTAHEICQTCKILLVEANSSSLTDLAAAENEAAALGATEISNSYGAGETSGQTTWDSSYSHSGVAITASTGDWGYGVYYPASSPGVIAVGGTTLRLNANGTYSSETVWSSSGSGCSLYETANKWQTSVANWSQTQCSSHRGAADVAADADPNTGAAVYDSTPYNGSTGWWQVGGTSLSSPLIASAIALAGGMAGVANPQSVPYANFNSTNSHDITSGSDGSCTTIMCTATSGYDGPTGLGSPNGTAGFGGSGTPSPGPTPTPTCTVRGKGGKCH